MIFEELQDRCNDEELAIVVAVAHNIWFRQNSVVHGGSLKHPTEVFRDTKVSMEDYKRATTPVVEDHVSFLSPQAGRWQAPPLGIVKVNWDAAIDNKNG